jgi:hypothetical protein
MYIQTTHAREVGRETYIRSLWYLMLPPQAGYFERLRARFGSSALLFANTETFLMTFFKFYPGREPGMLIAIDQKHVRRFGKVIDRLGLKVAEFSGQQELAGVLANPRVLAVILPEAYDVSASKYKKVYDESSAVKIIYQHRKKPRSVSLDHDVYLWEPRSLPKTVSGVVVVIDKEKIPATHADVKAYNSFLPRMTNADFVSEIRRARGGFENKYRRIDLRPARILARVLYNFYI